MFISAGEAVIHTLTVTLSVVVLGISTNAYLKKGGGRYFALADAFLFLVLSQTVQFFESFYLNDFIYVPYLDVHFSHLLDLAMLLSFGTALVVK